MTNRIRFRARARAGGGGVSYDADAQAYITATGELFPEALNALVVGIKAAALWDDHIGSIKKAIGVPSLAASLIDLRNTAFNGTAVNTPGHSATAGWDFLQASSQYIADPWGPGIGNSKGTQDDVHFGRRIRHALNAGGSTVRTPGISNPDAATHFGVALMEPGIQFFKLNDNTNIGPTHATNYTGHFIGSRIGTARAVYRNSASVAADTQASTGVTNLALPIGARNLAGVIDGFFTGRISIQHGGAGLDAAQAAALTALFDTYAIAAGET